MLRMQLLKEQLLAKGYGPRRRDSVLEVGKSNPSPSE